MGKWGKKMKNNQKWENPAGAVNDKELAKLAGGNDVNPNTTPILIPISLALCPTTTCASISRPCNNK